MKEKRKVQLLVEERRKLERMKEKEALEKADAFYKRYLMRFYGMNGLKKLVAMNRQKSQIAEKKYAQAIFMKCFNPWRSSIRVDLSIREKRADDFYNKYLLKNYYINGVKSFKQHAQIEMAKATRFYRFHIKFKLFQAWSVYTQNEKRACVEYDLLVAEHNLSRMKRSYFLIWRQFPAEARRLRARQKRLDELRNKVKEIIPDYDPNSLSSTSGWSTAN